MKTIFRNLVYTFKNFKWTIFINILGLSVAFASFMLILMQLNYVYNFDRFHQNYDKIYRLEANFNQGWSTVISRPVTEVFKNSSPHILAGAISNPWAKELLMNIEIDGYNHFYKEMGIMVSADYPDIFTFDIIEGSKEVLHDPEKILIPHSIAKKIFKNESAIGKQITTDNKIYTIGAVFKDFPNNTSTPNYIYLPISKDENLDNWGNWNYMFFIRLDKAESIEGLIENFECQFDMSTILGKDFSMEENNISLSLRFTHLPDLHYTTDVIYDYTPKSSRHTLAVLLAIAILILTIAGINFTNFSIALTPKRLKSINIQKVLGRETNKIRHSLIIETILLTLSSFL